MPPQDLNIIINMAPTTTGIIDNDDDVAVADIVVNNHHHIVSMITNNNDVDADVSGNNNKLANNNTTPEDVQLARKKKVSYDNYGSIITPKNEHNTNNTEDDNDHNTVNDNENDNDEYILDNNNKKHKSTTRRPSNEYVLNVAFYTFLSFCIFQLIFAVYVAHSQSMKADSEAMSIDALTYLFNLVAERLKKSKLTPYEKTLAPNVCQYQRKLRRLYLELIPPAISVITLLIITMFTLREAIQTLHGVTDSDSDDVSIGLMLLFSSANLLLDFVNVTCFARSHSLFGLQMIHNENQLITDSIRSISISTETTTKSEEEDSIIASSKNVNEHGEIISNNNNCNSCACHNSHHHIRQQQQNFTNTPSSKNDSEQQPHDEMGSLLPTTPIINDHERPESTNIFSNLNMCSAWTHVCADTLRSAAVVIAASIAMIIPTINHSVADSIAAIVVSIIIFGSVIPLIQGLIVTAIQIITLHYHNPSNTNTTKTTTNKHSSPIQAMIDV